MTKSVVSPFLVGRLFNIVWEECESRGITRIRMEDKFVDELWIQMSLDLFISKQILIFDFRLSFFDFQAINKGLRVSSRGCVPSNVSDEIEKKKITR